MREMDRMAGGEGREEVKRGREGERERGRGGGGVDPIKVSSTQTSVWEVFSFEVTCNPAAVSLFTTSCRALVCDMLFSLALSLYLKAKVH